MATIQLTEALFYKDGTSGVSAVVGYETGERRVVRYTFTAPNVGAQKVSLTLHTAGLQSGSHNPLRFHIGTEPDSHANAGNDYEMTGELILQTDGVAFKGSADILLLPGATYYLWVFPAQDSFGWYSWQDYDDVSIMETEGIVFLLPVVAGGVWHRILLYVVIGGKWYLIALCSIIGGKWRYIGSE